MYSLIVDKIIKMRLIGILAIFFKHQALPKCSQIQAKAMFVQNDPNSNQNPYLIRMFPKDTKFDKFRNCHRRQFRKGLKTVLEVRNNDFFENIPQRN